MLQSPAIILFDDNYFKNLWSLNFTKPIAKLRLGYFTIEEIWQQLSKTSISFLTVNYLSQKYPTSFSNDNIYINAAMLPSIQLWQDIITLKTDEALQQNDRLIACRSSASYQKAETLINEKFKNKPHTTKIEWLNRPKDFFKKVSLSLQLDELLLDKNAFQQNTLLHQQNVIFNEAQCFIHPTATVKGVTINAEKGPVIIGENALVMEGSMLRGPLSICNNAVIKMGAKIYGPTAIGPYCKVGGEISNVVFQGYANKGHDGYLGNAVIGEWCNIGADSNCSNLKNNYSSIKIWNYSDEDFIDSEEQFHGLIMGDHTKCGINTMFNTGTVTGVFANILGGDFLPKFIPSFTWGQNETYQFEKAIETAKRVMQRRNVILHQYDIDILKHIFTLTETYRQQSL